MIAPQESQGCKQCSGCERELSLDQFDQYTKKHYEYFPDCISCREERLVKDRERRKIYKEEHFDEVVYKEYQQSARKRDISFNLTQEQISELMWNVCFYCGRQADKETFNRNGLDRINADSPYDVNHVVVCCWRCNKCKNDLTQQEFFALCKEVVVRHHLLEKE